MRTLEVNLVNSQKIKKDVKICNYGCGREARFQFKNGKRCCEEHPTKCPESRRKNSMSKVGRRHTKEEIIKMKNSMRGIPHLKARNKQKTIEHKKKISLSNKCRPKSKEHRKNLSKSKIGNKLKFKDPLERARKIRLSCLKTLSKRHGQCSPFYNPEACKLIDEYGKRYDYNFQHAENGGEFHIKELGYWVDGYDKKNNVVVEVDELHHFDIDGNLLEKDCRRQREIKEFLGCVFIRLRVDE